MVEIPLHPAVVALMARLRDLDCSSIFTAETRGMERAVASRSAEFFAGRNLARQALAQLDVAPCALPRNEDRSPRWPIGVKGSISHTTEWVIVAVTNSGDISAVGADLEVEQSVSPDLGPIVRTSSCDEALDDTIVFSAKESVYKAVYPICGEFLEFSDVTIKRGEQPNRFAAEGRPGMNSSRLMSRGSGLIVPFDKMVLTCFIVPS